MPHLNSLTIVLWIATSAAEVFLVLSMARNGSWRRWFPLFVFLCVLLARELVCLAAVIAESNFAYFWGYWTATFFAEVTEVFVILATFRSLIVGTPRLVRLVNRCIVIGLFIITSVTVFISFTDRTPTYYKVVYVAQHLDIAVSLAWLLLFVIAVLGTALAGIQWSNRAQGIGFGFLLQSISGTLSSLAVIHAPQSVLCGSLRELCFLAALITWFVTLLPSRGEAALFPLPQSVLPFRRRLLGR